MADEHAEPLMYASAMEDQSAPEQRRKEPSNHALKMMTGASCLVAVLALTVALVAIHETGKPNNNSPSSAGATTSTVTDASVSRVSATPSRASLDIASAEADFSTRIHNLVAGLTSTVTDASVSRVSATPSRASLDIARAEADYSTRIHSLVAGLPQCSANMKMYKACEQVKDLASGLVKHLADEQPTVDAFANSVRAGLLGKHAFVAKDGAFIAAPPHLKHLEGQVHPLADTTRCTHVSKSSVCVAALMNAAAADVNSVEGRSVIATWVHPNPPTAHFYRRSFGSDALDTASDALDMGHTLVQNWQDMSRRSVESGAVNGAMHGAVAGAISGVAGGPVGVITGGLTGAATGAAEGGLTAAGNVVDNSAMKDLSTTAEQAFGDDGW